MTDNVKTFFAKVKDKLGWRHNGAFVAIHFAAESSQITLTSDDCISDYVREYESKGIVFTANFWGDEQGYIERLPSRPLLRRVFIEPEIVYEEIDGDFALDEDKNKIPTGDVIPGRYEWTYVFTVDLKHEHSQKVINSTMTTDEKTLRLIELQVIREYT